MTRELTTQQTPAKTDAAPSGTSGFTRAIWVALALLAVVQGAVIAVQRSFLPSKVRPLRHAISDLPLTIGTWSGKDTKVDPKLFAAVGADQQLNRVYTNATGDPVTVHCAGFVAADEWTPHVPELCFTGNGWTPLDSQVVTLPERPNVSIFLQTYEKSGQRVLTAYWYQLDDRAYVDRNGARKVRQAQWGRREWPPLIKTLLQTDASPNAESRLIDIAGRLYEFNIGL